MEVVGNSVVCEFYDLSQYLQGQMSSNGIKFVMSDYFAFTRRYFKSYGPIFLFLSLYDIACILSTYGESLVNPTRRMAVRSRC